MNNTILLANGISASMDTTRSFAERMQIGAEVAILGLGVVFAVLILLWGILSLFKVFFYDIPNAKKAAPKETAPAPAEVPAPVQTAPASASDDELVAAISAAVAAYMSAEGCPASGFRVVSFRRK